MKNISKTIVSSANITSWSPTDASMILTEQIDRGYSIPINQKFMSSLPATYLIGEDNNIRTGYMERFVQLLEHLKSLKMKRIVTDSQVDEIMLQFELLEQHRHELPAHPGEVVVICNGELFYGQDLVETVKKAELKHGKRPHYSESIGLVEYPSIFE